MESEQSSSISPFEIELSTGATSPSTKADSNLQLPAICDPPGMNNPHKQAVWVIFGATGLLGRPLAMRALKARDLVAAVGRISQPAPSVTGDDENGIDLSCDVRIRQTVEKVFSEVFKKWGRIDIVVNCSGYGVMGACEDQTAFEVKNQFDTNVMGTLHIVQSSLPFLRTQGHGRYLIYSSTAGASGLPGMGPYCATKYATEALTESLMHEIAPFNLHATLLQVGLVRRETDVMPTWGHFLVAPTSKPYAGPTAPAGHAQRMGAFIADRSPSSVFKAAELVWQLGHCSFPPLRLLLGNFAVDNVRDRWRCILEEIEDWKHLNFPIEESDQGKPTAPVDEVENS